MAKTSKNPRIAKLTEGHASLANHLTGIGIPSSRQEGLLTLAEKVDKAVVVKGTTVEAKVSASGKIYQGEFIQQVYELEGAEELRFVLEDAKVLCSGLSGERQISVVYAQRGKTFIKAAKYDGGTITLGNSLELLDEEIEAAVLLEVAAGRIGVLFNAVAAGQIALIKYEGLTGSKLYIEAWDVDDPCNIAASKLKDGKILTSCVRQSEEYRGRAFLAVVNCSDVKATLGPEMELEAEYDDDEYAGAWSVSSISPLTAVVSFFNAHSKPVGFAVVDVDEADKLTTRHVGECVYIGSLPATATMMINETHWAFVNGIARVDAVGTVTKTSIAIEVWHTTKYGAEPSWYAAEEVNFNVALGRVAILPMRPAAAVTYTIDNIVRTMLIDISDTGLEGYPSVQMGSFEGFGLVVPLTAACGLFVYQKGGSGYIRAVKRVPTIVTSETAIHGVARTGGGPGSVIPVVCKQ